jgi:hypothetical protein
MIPLSAVGVVLLLRLFGWVLAGFKSVEWLRDVRALFELSWDSQ